MGRSFCKQSIFVLLLIVMFGAVCFSQAEDGNTQSTQGAEVIGENDHLPFMQADPVAPESQEPSSGGLLLKTMGAMLLVVGLIFFGAWGAKKLGFGGSKSSSSPDDPELTVLSTVSMGSGRTIATLQFGDRILLVGSTNDSFTLLAEDVKAETPARSRSVAELLAEENESFDSAFQNAQFKLGQWGEKG